MLLWSHTGHNYTWFPMYRLLVHSRMTFFCRLVLTFKKVIVVPECFDCLWYLKACLVAALKSHLSQLKLIPSCFYCLWSLRLPLCFALCSHWSQSIIIPSYFDCLCTLSCLVLTLITIRFDIHVFWFFMNPKIDFVVFSESSFVFLYVPCFDRVCTLIFLLVFALY